MQEFMSPQTMMLRKGYFSRNNLRLDLICYTWIAFLSFLEVKCVEKII